MCVLECRIIAGATHNFHTPGAMDANLIFIIIFILQFIPYIIPETKTPYSMGSTNSFVTHYSSRKDTVYKRIVDGIQVHSFGLSTCLYKFPQLLPSSLWGNVVMFKPFPASGVIPYCWVNSVFIQKRILRQQTWKIRWFKRRFRIRILFPLFLFSSNGVA